MRREMVGELAAEALGTFIIVLFGTGSVAMVAILFVVVTQVIAVFQTFGQPFFITSGGPGDSSRTIIMFLLDVVWRHFQYGYGAAIAITLALIMCLITAIQFTVLGRNTTQY